MNERPVLTVFRSRLREENTADFQATVPRIEELARAMPGFLEYKTFTAEDGERVSIIVFDTLDHHLAWRRHAEHVEAQRLGRDRFYASYDISVCELVRTSTWPDKRTQ